MTPNSNHDDEINIWCDWLMDNGCDSDEIRFEEIVNYWSYECRYMTRHSYGRVGPVVIGFYDPMKVGTGGTMGTSKVGCDNFITYVGGGV